jgi:hypothetical protein
MLRTVSSLFLSFVVLANSACLTERYTGQFISRWSFTVREEEGCVEFFGCIFDTLGVTDQNGGAINVISPHDIWLTDCVFHLCSVYNWGVTNTDYGGAVYLQSDNIQIDRCCASNCRAEEGQACFFEKGSVIPTVGLSSFVNCSYPGDGDADTGAVSCGYVVGLYLSYCNFSECHVVSGGFFDTKYGSALSLWGQDQASTAWITWSVITGCGGLSSIDATSSQSGHSLTIEYCVFYLNRCDSCDIRVTRLQLSVRDCHFFKNTQNRPFATLNSAIITISNSYFDIPARPTDVNYGEVDAIWGLTSQSWSLTCYLSTVYCQVSPFCPTTQFIRINEQRAMMTARSGQLGAFAP